MEQELTSIKRRIPGVGSAVVEQELTSLKRRIPAVGSPGVEQKLTPLKRRIPGAWCRESLGGAGVNITEEENIWCKV